MVVLLKKEIIKIIHRLGQLPLKVAIPIGISAFSVITYGVAFFIEKPVEFSYAGTTCVQQLTMLPSLHKPVGQAAFDVKTDKVFKIAKWQVASLETCFNPKQAPQAGLSKVSTAPFGGLFAKKTFALTIAKPPVARTDSLTKPVPTAKPLTIGLSSVDTVFEYELEVDDKAAACPLKKSVLHCNIESLDLAQGRGYDVELVRSFKDKQKIVVAKKTIETLTATSVVKSSIGEGQAVFEKPKSFTVEFDKAVVGADIVLEKVEADKRTKISSNSSFSDKQATVTLSEDLPREASYELLIDKLEAKDGSTLVDPYKVSFKVLGGPKVTNVNVGATGAALTQTVVLTFDQPLSDTQDITKFVSIKGVAAVISKKDNQVFVSYANAPKCTDFTISIIKGLESKYQIVQNVPWGFNSRTVCHTISTIGYSKDGRPITAYYFGNGSRTVLFTGGIHGSERNSKVLMEAWVDELELNARNIPADKQIVVVPSLNPDGIAASRRNNSNNVDLNRNFDTSDWTKDISSPSNQPIENGGGTSPMSEPETKVIAALTNLLRPRLTMSFHSSAAYVIANQAGDSSALASVYANSSGYRNMTGNSGAFSYPITGTYDDWIGEKLGLPSVLVELASSYSAEFSRNKAALWAMVRS